MNSPLVGFFSDSSPETNADLSAAFRKGLNETGFIEGRNVAIEYRWASAQFDRLPGLAAALVHRRVAVIAAMGGTMRHLPLRRRPRPFGSNGIASFDLIRHHRANESIFLYAFDLIELNGDDLPRVACCWWARAGSWWASLPMPTPPVSEGRRAP
jgi:hypothetical protein